MDDLSFGKGVMKPADAEESASFTITVKDYIIDGAEYETSGGETLRACAETLKSMILGKDARDLFQMTNNVIYYNIEPELKRSELYLASICVLAAKRAAADWCRKNSVPFDEGSCCCV